MSHFSSKRATAASLGAVLSLTTDDLNVVVPDGAGNIDLNGAHGINTTGAVANQAVVQIDNAITLGDLSDIAADTDALTLATGDITFSATNNVGNLRLPTTHSSGNAGVIIFGANTRIHNSPSGSGNIFFGNVAGNFTGTGTGNTGLGQEAMGAFTTGSDNVGIGRTALDNLTSGGQNVAIGVDSLDAALTGNGNVAIGMQAMTDAISAEWNVAVGRSAMVSLTTGDRNVAIGAGEDGTSGVLDNLLTGSYNVAIGASLTTTTGGAGTAYTGAESSNIVIGNATTGTVGESNVMRLGTSGSGNGQVNKAFIGGVDGVDIGSVAKVLTMASSQVGTATITAGANITVTPGANTITIASTASGGLTWSVETGATKAMAVNEGYFSDRTGATLAFTLPATAAVGDTMEIAQMEAGQLWTLAQNAGQTCYIGTSSTTTGVGGSLAATADGDWIELVCRVANTDFQVNVKSGNITVV